MYYTIEELESGKVFRVWVDPAIMSRDDLVDDLQQRNWVTHVSRTRGDKLHVQADKAVHGSPASRLKQILDAIVKRHHKSSAEPQPPLVRAMRYQGVGPSDSALNALDEPIPSDSTLRSDSTNDALHIVREVAMLFPGASRLEVTTPDGLMVTVWK